MPALLHDKVPQVQIMPSRVMLRSGDIEYFAVIMIVGCCGAKIRIKVKSER